MAQTIDKRPKSVQNNLDQGRELLEEGRYLESIVYLDSCIGKRPRNPEPYLLRAMCKESLGDFEGALLDYNILAGLNPELNEAYFGRAVLRYRMGHYELSLQDLETLRNLPPGPTQAVYFKTRVGESGVSDISTLKTGQPEILQYIGLNQAKLSRHSEAITTFSQAIQANPNQADYYINRGLSKQELGDLGGATVDFQTALLLEPDNALASYNLTNLRLVAEDESLLIESYSMVIDQNPGLASAYTQRGLQYFNIGNYRSALVDYDSALKLDTSNPDSWYNRGLAREKLGELDSACSDFTQAIALQPGLGAAFSSRGNIFYKTRHYQLAIDDYDRAIEIDPSKSDNYYNRGLAKYYYGQEASGCSDIKRAVTLGLESAREAVEKLCQ